MFLHLLIGITVLTVITGGIAQSARRRVPHES